MSYSWPPFASYFISRRTHCASLKFPMLNDSGSDVVDYGELERDVGSKGEDTTPFVRC